MLRQGVLCSPWSDGCSAEDGTQGLMCKPSYDHRASPPAHGQHSSCRRSMFVEGAFQVRGVVQLRETLFLPP